MITMKINGVTKRFEDYGFRASLEHVVSFGESAHSSLSIPGIPGAFLYNQEITPTSFAVALTMVENDEIRAIGNINNLISYLFDDEAKAREITLVMDYEPDKHRKGYIIGGVEAVRNSIMTRQQLQFICYDPYKYSNVENDDVTWGSEELTFLSTAYTLGHTNTSANFSVIGPSSISVEVIGLAIKPVIEISGTATNLVIDNKGKKLHVGSFATSQVSVDTGKYIAYKNGTETMIDMDDFLLNRGTNVVKFTGTDINITVTIRFRDRWK